MSQSWHMVIWRNIMERIHSELEYKDFTVPSSVVQRTICTQTGKLAVDGCPALTEYFDKDTVVKESCSGHGYVDSEEPDDETDENTDSSNGDSTTTPGTPSGGNSGSDNTGGGNTGSGDNTGGNTGGGNTGSGDNTGGGNTGGGSEETQPPAS